MKVVEGQTCWVLRFGKWHEAAFQYWLIRPSAATVVLKENGAPLCVGFDSVRFLKPDERS